MGSLTVVTPYFWLRFSAKNKVLRLLPKDLPHPSLMDRLSIGYNGKSIRRLHRPRRFSRRERGPIRLIERDNCRLDLFRGCDYKIRISAHRGE